MGITSEYVDFCSGIQYEDLPPEVIDYAKRLCLDFVGVALYGTRADSSKATVAFIKSLDLPGDCTTIGTMLKCPQQYAALANGTFVKGNELDDVEASSALHPGPSVWPVVLAMGEKYHLDGKQLITAAILGYETIIRLGRAINAPIHFKRGFHSSSTCGHFAATMAASKLLNLNKQQMNDALGLAGSQTSGSFRYILAGSWTKAFHSGWASHSGILAAHLARQGFNAPTDILEGQYGFLQAYSENTQPSLILQDLGKVYWTLRTGIKLHSACRQEHSQLDAILHIVKANDLKPDDIQRVDIYMIKLAYLFVVEPEEVKRAPKNVVDQMHSMFFGAAMAIIKRKAFVEEHAEGWLHSPQVKNLIEKIYCHHDPELDKLTPEKFPARVVIQTRDGEKFEKAVEVPHGDGLDPLSLEELRDKYGFLASSILSRKHVEEIEEMILQLEKVKDFGKVASLLAGNAGEEQS